MTVLFVSPMLNFEFKKQSRSQLFYNQYQYCLVFRLPHASFLRDLDHRSIAQAVSWRNYRKRTQSTWFTSVTAEQEADLYAVCDFMLKQKDYKKVMSGNGIWIYTNDYRPWEQFENKTTANLRFTSGSEAVVCLPKDTVVLKHPRHAYRTYFRNTWVDTDQSELIKKFFRSRKNQFAPSPSFGEFLKGERQWISDYNFVDHNDSKLEFLIALACPGIVSKTKPIVSKYQTMVVDDK